MQRQQKSGFRCSSFHTPLFHFRFHDCGEQKTKWIQYVSVPKFETLETYLARWSTCCHCRCHTSPWLERSRRKVTRPFRAHFVVSILLCYCCCCSCAVAGRKWTARQTPSQQGDAFQETAAATPCSCVSPVEFRHC